MSLATKYRPSNINDVMGQSLVTDILKAEIENNTIRQQYLFVGKSGSGKTTVARILATVLNGMTLEIDTANNNRAEDIKEIIKSVNIKPIGYDKMVVILDEVQALSSTGIQTLLLALENTPKHVIFVLCTTEGDKIPFTIKNRCEILEFNSISFEAICERLEYICKQENIIYEHEALEAIARYADGSLRQAISHLEKVSMLKVDNNAVSKYLKQSKYDDLFNLFYGICDRDIQSAVTIIDNVHNIDKFVANFFTFTLDICLFAKLKSMENLTMPQVFIEDLAKLSSSDMKLATMLLDELFELQYMGRNNPILKQLLITVALKLANRG